MRITVDATALLGPRTGVGQYAAQLVSHLPAALARSGCSAELQASTWTWRGGRVPGLPPGVSQVGRRVPARALRALWQHGSWPPVEHLVGDTDVFHGLNFVSPPTRRSAEVVTVHDLTYIEHASTVSPVDLAYRDLVQRALDRGAHVVTPSSHVADRVRELYQLGTDRVTATPLGLDPVWGTATPADTRWLEAHGIVDDYIVFVGSRGLRKNLTRLIQAHEQLRLSGERVVLVLAGPAGSATDLEGHPGVRLTGWLEDVELRSLVAGSRALALPSLDEGFGLPVLEALATGRPVVASDIPALHEVAGTHARFADPLDTDSLAQALADALGAPDDAGARAARRAWAAGFTWDRTADRTVDVYRRVAR
ncbi:MAG: glycosyltransferase family 4 protein [Actinobacteria bacterium]|nr:glycosyltransferase family 4 protein [Actinomycetota bacterium]MCG2801477.1 glycosyltransferase family 4 protein [Cellulomonas sp.]